MKRPSLLFTLAVAGVLASCRTHVVQRQVPSPEAEAPLSFAVRAWEVVEESRVVGVVVEFEESGGARNFCSVRNAQHQELGLIDEHGRAWRYRPHAEEPDWLVTGTILDGVQAILELSSGARIFEVPLATLRAESR